MPLKEFQRINYNIFSGWFVLFFVFIFYYFGEVLFFMLFTPLAFNFGGLHQTSHISVCERCACAQTAFVNALVRLLLLLLDVFFSSFFYSMITQVHWHIGDLLNPKFCSLRSSDSISVFLLLSCRFLFEFSLFIFFNFNGKKTFNIFLKTFYLFYRNIFCRINLHFVSETSATKKTVKFNQPELYLY